MSENEATYQVPAGLPVEGVNLVVGGEDNEDLLGSHCIGFVVLKFKKMKLFV